MTTFNYQPDGSQFTSFFKNNRSIFSFLLFALVVLILFFDIFKVNSPTQYSVVTTLGKISSVQGSGLYLKIPLISRAVTYDTSIQSIECISSTGKDNCQTLDGGTKDLQAVKVSVQVSYQIDPTRLEELYKLVQDQQTFNNIIVPSTVEEALKVTTAKYTGEELVVKREEVKSTLEKELQERLNKFYLKVVAINIVNFEFGTSFQAEIDKKVATQQQVLQKEQELKRVEAESKIKITQAEADAKTIQIQGEALRKNPESLELEKIKKWDGKLPTVQTSQNPIISIPVEKK